MEDLLISGIQHFVFCRRQWALSYIENQWEDNYLTLSGQLVHKRADDPEIKEKRKNIISIGGMRVRSEEYHIRGQCDVVELHRSEEGVYLPRWKGTFKLFPIEYKRGKPKTNHSDILQLLAEAICLEEMTASSIPSGAIYYDQTRRRELVDFTDELRSELIDILSEMQELMDKQYTPKVKRTPKCRSCSLRDICLPELGNRQQASTYIESMLKEM